MRIRRVTRPLNTAILGLLIVATVCSPPALGEESTLEGRRTAYLTWALDNFSALEPTMKTHDGRAWSLNQARLSKNVDLEKANTYFATITLTHDPDFMGIRLLRTLLQFGDSGRLSPEARSHLEDIIKGWNMEKPNSRVAQWPPFHTENHDLMFLTLGLFSQQLRGESIDAHLAELRKALGWRYERGFYEWGSHRYQLHYTNPLLVLEEHAPAEDIRRGATELFNIILAERALMSVGGYLGGPGMRSYGRNRGCDYLDNNRYDSFLPTVWLALGVGEPRFDFASSGGLEPAGDGYGNGKDPRLNQDEGMFFATSRVTPYPEVLALFSDVAATEELVYVGRRASAGHPFQNSTPDKPRSHQILYYYNTPHISMGSLQYLDYAGKMSVSYNSRPRFFSILFPERPEQVLRTELTEEELKSADPRKYDYTADRVVQHQNWLLAAGELSASHGLTSKKIGSWDLFEVGKGLCAHIDLGEGWHVFQASDLDHFADGETFVSALTLPGRDSGRISGTTTGGDTVSVELKTMSIDINGKRREPPLSMLHDSSFLRSEFGSGVVTLVTSAGTRVFDREATFSVAGG